MKNLLIALSLQALCLSVSFADATSVNPCNKPSPTPWPSQNCGDNMNQRNASKALLNTCLGKWSSINNKNNAPKAASFGNCSTEFNNYMNDANTVITCLKNLK